MISLQTFALNVLNVMKYSVITLSIQFFCFKQLLVPLLYLIMVNIINSFT